MLLVFLLTNSVMKKALNNAENQYIESCSHALEGYSNAVYYYLENHYTSLLSIFNEEIFSTDDMDKIQIWLMENMPHVHEDICLTYYVASDNIAYFSNGLIANLSTRDYLRNFDYADGDVFVSNLVESEFFDEPVFIVGKPYYSEYFELKGILCAMVDVKCLGEVINKIKVGKGNCIYLQDRCGFFISHPNSEFIGEPFKPVHSRYSATSLDFISYSDSNFIETENEKGEKIDLFFTKIPVCGWTLSVAYPKSHLEKIYSEQNFTKVLILGISILSLVFLLIVETALLNYFHRNQLIETIYDPLTNLWTRGRFEAAASRMISRQPDAKYVLVESDIHGFKFINGNYGEEEADRIIYFFSTLVNKITRRHNGIIGRGYADHFYSFVKITRIKKTMETFRAALKEVNDEIKSFDVPFFPKCGISFYRPTKNMGTTIKDLIGQASFAKSTIKDNILVPYAIYDSHLVEKVNEERYMESNMEAALENEEFFVMYQPKISLIDDKIVGAEALVRWRTKEKGIISPDKFIPLFERNGFVKRLDFFVYESVFRFIREQLDAGKPVVPVSVNMSRNHDKPEKFVRDFIDLFQRFQIPTDLVQVEIIERSSMDNSILTDITDMLHKAGFTVAMDDFGTGESSLNMLAKVPVDVLKFDRSFLLSSMTHNGTLDEKSAMFIKVLMDLSKHLKKQTVFEGVETEIQRDFLRSIDCDQVQGYFYSRPLPEDEFVAFVKEHL